MMMLSAAPQKPSAVAAQSLGESALVLRGMACPYVLELLSALDCIQTGAPFRHMVTPGGYAMSAALTNCGRLGWITDRRGYRYSEIDPLTAAPWPDMPEVFLYLAREAAARAGFGEFSSDACPINRYVPGARLTLHQDKNERDFDAPICGDISRARCTRSTASTTPPATSKVCTELALYPRLGTSPQPRLASSSC